MWKRGGGGKLGGGLETCKVRRGRKERERGKRAVRMGGGGERLGVGGKLRVETWKAGQGR